MGVRIKLWRTDLGSGDPDERTRSVPTSQKDIWTAATSPLHANLIACGQATRDRLEAVPFALFVDVMGTQQDLVPGKKDREARCRERLDAFHR
jgi:hypothetical protein